LPARWMNRYVACGSTGYKVEYFAAPFAENFFEVGEDRGRDDAFEAAAVYL